MRSQDKFRGCLIGGTAGDALGFAVEFLREKKIFNTYENRVYRGRYFVWSKEL